MKTEDIRNMNVEEIAHKIDTLKKEHYELRMQAKTGKLEKQHKIKAVKRDIARLLTIQKEMLAQK